MTIIVDKEDQDLLDNYKWYIHNSNNKQYIKGKLGRLHRVILTRVLGDITGQLVDHINGDTFDNRRSNLRLCTSSQNNCNRKKRSDNGTGYKWVTKDRGKFRADVSLEDVRYRQSFSTPEDAYRWACEVAAGLHGEFLKLA